MAKTQGEIYNELRAMDFAERNAALAKLKVNDPAMYEAIRELGIKSRDQYLNTTSFNQAENMAKEAEAKFKEIQQNKDVKARNAAYTQLKRENPAMFGVLEQVAAKSGVRFKRVQPQQKAQQQQPAQQKPAQTRAQAQPQVQEPIDLTRPADNQMSFANNWGNTAAPEYAPKTAAPKAAEAKAPGKAPKADEHQVVGDGTSKSHRFDSQTQETATPARESAGSSGRTAAPAPARESAANTGNSDIDTMIKKIEYMNSRNGASRSIDAADTAAKLHELYGENAIALLDKALNEPTNYATATGANVKTSRAAVQHLANLDKENANQLACNVLGIEIEQPQVDDRPKEDRLKEQLTQLAEGDSKSYGDLGSALGNIALGRDVDESMNKLISSLMQQCGYSEDAIMQFVADANRSMSDIEQGGATRQNDASGNAMANTAAGNTREDGTVNPAPAQDMDLEALRKAGINISEDSIAALRALGVKVESGRVQVDASGRVVGFTPHEKTAEQRTAKVQNSRQDMASTTGLNARGDTAVHDELKREEEVAKARELMKTPRKFKSVKKAYEKAAASGDTRAAELLAIMNEVDNTTKRETAQTAQNDQQKAQKVIAATEQKAEKGGLSITPQTQTKETATPAQTMDLATLQRYLDKQSGRRS